MTAETHRRTLLSLLAVSHADGPSGEHDFTFSRGEMKYMFTKLNAISSPEIANVHCLCLESATSHGKDDRVDATEAPSPAKTSSDGSAQQSRVPTDVNKEK